MRLYLQLGYGVLRITGFLCSPLPKKDLVEELGERALYQVPGGSTCFLCFPERLFTLQTSASV